MPANIQRAVQQQKPEAAARQSVNTMLNSLLDGEKMRRRFEELLGKRTPQFLSSLVSMINDNRDLQEAFYQSPMSVVKSALQAASYDLPIDPALGFAYIVPFNNSYKDENGNWQKKKQATFVIGYKGILSVVHPTHRHSGKWRDRPAHRRYRNRNAASSATNIIGVFKRKTPGKLHIRAACGIQTVRPAV